MDAQRRRQHPRGRRRRRGALGGLDLLVNCVGINREQRIAEGTARPSTRSTA
jgi:hypothetical protein